MTSEITDTEYIILENLYEQKGQNQALKQRDLARAARTSLGMINSILKRMVQKGWITARKLNSRNINYAITMDGINEIIHRSYNYFKRTIKNVAYYKDAINEIIQKAAEKNIKTVILLGTSDIDFIIEHSCSCYGINLIKSADNYFYSGISDDNTFIFFAEDIPFSEDIPFLSNEKENCFYISSLLLKIKGEQ